MLDKSIEFAIWWLTRFAESLTAIALPESSEPASLQSVMNHGALRVLIELILLYYRSNESTLKLFKTATIS